MLPTTKIYQVDFKYLIDNALDSKKLWGKQWVVFQYDKVTISMRLSSINIDDNKLYLQLSLASYDYNSNNSYQARVTLPLDPVHQNFVAIKKSFVGAMRHLIFNYEMDIVSRWKGYQRALQFDDALKEQSRERAIAILDNEGITNADIREAFIDACEYKTSRDNASRFKSSYEYRVRPHYYLMLAAFFYPEDKEEYAKAEKLVGKLTPKYTDLVEGIQDYLKAVYGDYENEYLSQIELELESIY